MNFQNPIQFILHRNQVRNNSILFMRVFISTPSISTAILIVGQRKIKHHLSLIAILRKLSSTPSYLAQCYSLRIALIENGVHESEIYFTVQNLVQSSFLSSFRWGLGINLIVGLGSCQQKGSTFCAIFPMLQINTGEAPTKHHLSLNFGEKKWAPVESWKLLIVPVNTCTHFFISKNNNASYWVYFTSSVWVSHHK